MATEYKHIRTSILPFGFKDGKYRFSLCIDINPDIQEENPVEIKETLKSFMENYSIENGILESIKGNLKISINKGDTQKVEPIFNELLDEVKNVWSSFYKNDKSKIRPSSVDYPSVHKKGLYTNSLTTFFTNSEDKPKTDYILPETDSIRKAAVAQFSNLKSGSLDSYGATITKAFDELDQTITSFSQKLEGISSFSEDFNSIQADFTLNLRKRHFNLFDSINSIQDIWSYIDSNIILQRLFGKTIDFEIDTCKFANLTDFRISFDTSFETSGIKGLKKIEWQHLVTNCYQIKDGIIIVDEYPNLKNPIYLEARNYDVGGKLIGLKSIKEKYSDIWQKLNNKTLKESERFQLRKQLIALDTAAFTIGINIYNSSLKKIQDIENNILKLGKSSKDVTSLYLSDIRKGYRIATRSSVNERLTSLANRCVSIKNTEGSELKITLPDEFKIQHTTINNDSATHALLENEQGKLEKKEIQDEGLGSWSGENIAFTSVFSNLEDETNFEASVSEGSVDESTNFVVEYFSRFYKEEYTLKGVEYKKKTDPKITEDEQLVKLNTNTDGLKFTLAYSYPKERDLEDFPNIGNKKLVFGRDYEIFLTPEYKNGWAVPFDKLETLRNEYTHFLSLDFFKFRRNEPVKPIEFQLQTPLSDETGKPTYLRQGESVDKLVIRNISNTDDNKVYKTQQQSIRHILPPAISFQQAFWYNKIFEMIPEESYKWYMKYHFPTEENKLLKWNLKGENVEYLNKLCTLKEAIKGSTIMRSFYPNNCPINYLPDPLSIGFRFEFYKDKNRLKKAKNYKKYQQKEFYFSGKYPKINAWKLIVEDFNLNESELLVVNEKKEEITIRLEKGDELFISARTILSEDYEKQFETFGNYNDFTRNGNNDLLTPPFEFSLVHATQRPLVRPKFGNIIRPNKGYREKERDKTIFKTTITANIEQTGIYYDEAGIVRYLEENIPTGNLEVYAKWEEYKDDPKHLVADNWTPNEPINHIDKLSFKHIDKESPAIFETAIEVSNQLDTMEATMNKIASDRNDFKNYAVDLQLSYDVKETKFIEKYFWIKNKSKFTSYYPKDWGIEDENDDNEGSSKSKEYFNRLSADSFLVSILNSKKPNSPVVSDENITLVSVIEDINLDKTIYRKASMNRLRFFFERGRLTSGKGERIGFVVNEPNAKYNDFLVNNSLVSIVGRDIVSDSLKPYDGLFRNEDVLLTKANFVVNDPHDLKEFETKKKSDDLESFSPKYVKELGLMTYLPKFDKKLNLWYLDVEMDINDNKGRELHSPFLRFSIVHYQENSFNYNIDDQVDISKDCRLSEISKSRFVYILPSRNIKMKYGTRPVNGYKKGFIKVELSLDDSSLKNGNPITNSSKFYLVIRHRLQSEIKWIIADKNVEKDGSAFLKLDKMVAELEFIFYKKSTDYQFVILETEDWGNDNDTSFENLIENKNSRIVHVNTFEIKNDDL